MIRKFSETDLDTLLEVWLSASIKAHDFVASDFWHSQLDNMRNTYIPASEVYVYEKDRSVIGFYALVGDTVAAIFVAPDFQGVGIGKSLIAHAKSIRHTLSLSVYKANSASVAFYRSQGFEVTEEGFDEATGQDEYTMQWTLSN